MTVSETAKIFNAEIISMPDPDRKPVGVYCGDLLSWVMGHAKQDNLWVTIMTNKNVLAVASLIDISCVIITENAEYDEELAFLAKDKGINIIRCKDDSYSVCAKLNLVLNN